MIGIPGFDPFPRTRLGGFTLPVAAALLATLATAVSADSTLFRTATALQPGAIGQVRNIQLGRPIPRVVNGKIQLQLQQKQKPGVHPNQQLIEQALPPQVGKVVRPWLRWVFNPHPARPAEGTDAAETEEDTNERDAVDSRAPHDVKVEQIMRAAETAIRRKDWKAAQELLQRLLDLPEDSLHRTADGRWQSVRRTANQLIASAPKQFLEDYRTQYAGLAQQLLNEARRSGNTADFVNVATRFLNTPAGAEAANYLGSLHLDRGEFGLAAIWFDEITRSASPLSTDPTWRVKASLAYRQAGDTAASQKLLEGLSDPAGNRVNLGVGSVDPSTWIGGIGTTLPGRSLVLNDWIQMYGSVSRLGTSTGSEPLLTPIWSVPLTSSHTVRSRVNWIMQDLIDQDKGPILAAAPLVVGGRVIYRDLRGVRAVDIETGRTLWESVEGISPERIVAGLASQQADPRNMWRFRGQFQNDINEYQGQSVENHPLASLMFRDGIYGVISSDGRQVFVIEDHGILSRQQPGQNWGWDGSEVQDPYGVSWKTNRLVSYDLNTGRPRWSIGGPESLESFDLPLAGSFFYGAPAVDGEELLVVAGKGDDVRLWSLDRATGAPRWSQLIAYSDTRIEQDIGRRWYTAQVAADGGVIVCPTTVGWLVAVDRMRQSVLWAYRYVPASGSSESNPGSQFVPFRELSSQWAPSAPIIAGSTVVFTPPEESIIVALSLLDGRRLWEKPKESWLYLAGVFQERAVLVGRTEVAAFDVSTGKQLWTSPLAELRPTGRGQAVDNQFYLPLSNGELRVIDLKTGERTSRSYVSTQHPPLGNLAMHRGKLVALGPQGLVSFGQREAVMAEIKRRKAQDSNDSWALLREAEIHLLNREHQAALPLLSGVDLKGLTPDEQERRHKELIECLAAVIRQEPKSRLQELDQLGLQVTTIPEKRLHQQLTAESLIARAKFLDAFQILWTLADQQDIDGLLPRGDDPQVSVAPRVWLSSCLQELWSAAQGADREQVDAKIASIIAEAKSAKSEVRRRVAAVLSFHPSAVVLHDALVEELAAAEDFGGTQLELLKLTSGADRIVAARATERMARLMEQFKLPGDAAFYYRQLETEFGDVTWRDGQTGAAIVKQLRADGKIEPHQRSPLAAWDDRPLDIIQGPVQYMPPAQEVVIRSPLPYFISQIVEFQQQEQRLAFEQLQDGQFSWLTPLRSSLRNQGDGYTSSEFLGHELVIINRDVLHLISPVEKRILWAKSLDAGGEGGPFWRHATRPPTLAMVTASREDDQQMPVLHQAACTGRLAVVQPNYLCVYGRRSISVLDPRTGELRWRKDGIPQYAQVVGNRDMVCVVPQERTKSEAFRISDGKPLTIDRLGTMLGNAVQLSGDSVLLLEANATTDSSNPLDAQSIARLLRRLTFRSPKFVLRMHRPLEQSDRWRFEFPGGTLISPIDASELLVVQPDGHAARIDIHSGKKTDLDPAPRDDLKGRRIDSYALADAEHIYYVANVNNPTGFHYGESLPSVRAHGRIYAWNRSDGKLAWTQDVQNQNLVVDRFRSIPVLLFVTRSWNMKGNINFGTLNIQAIHKQTGKVLHKSSSPSIYGGGFHSLDVNLSEPSIEFKSFNQRMRLVPGNGPVATTKPAESVQPAPKN